MKRRNTLDWEEVRRRLQASAAREAGELSPEEVRVVLRRRAERLARPVDPPPSSGETAVLIFRLAAERYAFQLHSLAQVIVNPLCTPLPGGPAWLWGVLQVSGEIRPVWDLYRVLGMSAPQNGAAQNVLLLRCAGREFGVRSGAVEEIRLCAPVSEGAPDGGRFVKWTAPGVLPVLDPERLLSLEET